MVDDKGPATKPYRLKAGKKHLHNGQAVEPGQVVQLTDSAAKAFGDKFEPIEGGAVVTDPKAQPTPKGNPGAPQDAHGRDPNLPVAQPPPQAQ